MCQRTLCDVVTDELPAQELGEHRDFAVFLTGEASPSFNEPDDFIAVLYYNDPRKKENTQVAVVDTTHGAPHIHRNYLHGGRRRIRTSSTAVSGKLCRILKTTGKGSYTST